MKNLALVIALSALSTPAFAKVSGEICKGSNRDAQGITLIWNSAEDTATVNAQGQQLVYNLEAGSNGSDVASAYVSRNHGGLKVTFYDVDSSASGWSRDLGAFKLKCKDL
ncbi:MAG: hypothetical protein ACXVB9_12225 [Bdellovibrionota bacterium]